ncbi:single-stranded-DNA-specific exonuclease RecJ1 [Natrialba magadii ATCC 43099]|uniref:Phosphoesterase RecJ domain-containing protein n=1 Tax=Natrialba magadii (strain ATCC 43099 / DSM 3394 / CCM 3739 / CIP 104546 / IAM 13178 / JCM 8861 / NBRC 102185 / NCIMB 2190 / MS3) TaxID=547559 RepID=D3SVH1_NATMM|nr:DHH family phosphoesterase [Natrialba magadii]ADD05579.1 single-stranded-DNA-specific exonuclease RecJ1 [Natrialba magadii ATCC 43099]ELY30006.1 phosphoesterase RecJ domain-containing protein [Natrialba magadii ATCC 43099]
MAGPIPELEDRALECAQTLCEAERVLLASHIDADGLTSAAIASQALERAGIPFETVFEKQLDAAAIEAIAATEYDTVLFTDFGSGQLDEISVHEAAGAFTPVIADHHQPADAETDYHLNPLLFGINGASELSGAGASYVLARALAEVSDETIIPDGGSETAARADNRDLAALAIVGAVGDMQDSDGELHGANEHIVAEGVDAGVVEPSTDLALYGKQTRPLPKLLEYATDVRIPGISGSERGVLSFLDELPLELRRPADATGSDAGEWRRWAELTAEEKQTVASALVKRAVSRGVPAGKIDRLVGTAYVLCDEPVGTELRDASEFSTLLNATARYERADVGLAVCLGDRGAALEQARTLLRNHRRNLSNGIDLVTEEGVTQTDNLQWFHAEDRIRETIVGIVAGMAMGNEGISRSKPIIAFADKSGDDAGAGMDPDPDPDPKPTDDQHQEVKVSARGTHSLVRKGLDLSAVMGQASRAVGGDGGGHDVAAGATVPKGNEADFIEHADELVGEQLS